MTFTESKVWKNNIAVVHNNNVVVIYNYINRNENMINLFIFNLI